MKTTLPDREFQECLDRLLSDWTDQYRRGEDLPPERMCEYCPEFAEALAERIRDFKSEQAKAASEAASTHEPVLVPAKLGWYELWQQMEFTSIAHRVGDPGAEQVWLGFDSRQNRNVLVRVVPRTSPIDPDHDTFLGQAKRLSELHLPGVLPVLDFGIDGSFGYLVSDQIDGETLADLLAKGRLHQKQAVNLIIQVARIIHHAHSLGYVHGDLRPTNIWINKEGHVVVANFSLLAHRTVLPIAARDLSAQGMRYMAPEQILRHTFVSGEKADIYSLGVILYELLIGTHPYYTPETVELRKNIAIGVPGSLHTIDTAISSRLDAVCRRALAKAPIQRQSSAMQFANELVAAIAPPKRSASWLLLGTAAAAALALGGVLALATLSRPSHATMTTANPLSSKTPSTATAVPANEADRLASIIHHATHSGTHRSASGSATSPQDADESVASWTQKLASGLMPSPLDPASYAMASNNQSQGLDLATLLPTWSQFKSASYSSSVSSASNTPPATPAADAPQTTVDPNMSAPTTLLPAPRAYRIVDLLQILDPKVDAIAGQWQKQNDILRIFNEGYLQVAYETPAEYDLTMDFASTSGDLVGVQTPHLDSKFWWGITPEMSGIYWLAGNDLTKDANPTKRIFPLSDNRIYTLEIHVRNARYTVLMDDKVILDFPIDYRRVTNLNPSSLLRPPTAKFHPGSFVLYNHSGVLTVTRMQVREISSEGRLLNGAVPSSAIHFEALDAPHATNSGNGPSSSNQPRFIAPPLAPGLTSPNASANATATGQGMSPTPASGNSGTNGTPSAATPSAQPSDDAQANANGPFKPFNGLITDRPAMSEILKLWPALVPVVDNEYNLRKEIPNLYFARWDNNNHAAYFSARDPRSVAIVLTDPQTGLPVYPAGTNRDNCFVLLPQPSADPWRIPTLLGDTPPIEPNGRGMLVLPNDVKTDYDLTTKVNVTRGDMPFRIYLPAGDYRTVALDFNPVVGDGGQKRTMLLRLVGAPNVQTFYGGFFLKMNQVNDIKTRVRFMKEKGRIQILVLVNDRPIMLSDGPSSGLRNPPIDIAPQHIALESLYDSFVAFEEFKITLDRKTYRDWASQQGKR